MVEPTQPPADMKLRWGKNGEVTLKGTACGWHGRLPGGKLLAVVDVPDGTFTAFATGHSPMAYQHDKAGSAQEAVDAIHGMMSGEHALLGLALGET